MPRRVGTDQDLRTHAAARTTAVIVDACAALDLLRLPARLKDAARAQRELTAARTLIDDSDETAGTTLLVLPPPVPKEISDNRQEVVGVLNRAIENAALGVEVFQTLQAVVGLQSSLSFSRAELQALGQALSDTLDLLLDRALHVEANDRASAAATRRVVNELAPARKGGQVKDCMIVEHSLEIARPLLQAGCQKLLFISSNTNDYYDGQQALKPPLDNDFQLAGITFVTSWEWALAERV